VKSRAVGLLLGVLAVGCGEPAEPPSACKLAGPRVVSAVLAGGGARQAASQLRAQASDTASYSVCTVSGPGIQVRSAIDTASMNRRRYEGRYDERLEFFDTTDRARTATPVLGLADDRVFAPAGAFWVRAAQVMTAYGGERLVTVSLDARGLSEPAARAAASTLVTRLIGPRGRHAGAARIGGDAGAPEVSAVEPQDGETVRAASVKLVGSVNPAGAVVTVAGRRARVRGHVFAAVVALRPGRNRLALVARRGGERVASAVVRVERGPAGRALGASYARRHPRRVPTLDGERLDDALDILRGAGLRGRTRIADDAYRGPIERAHDWRVCFTDPSEGRPAPRRVLVVIDRVVERAGGVPCDFF
jgi:hypothetical protein